MNERCTNYHICRVSLFPEFSDLHISRSVEIQDIYKSENLFKYLTLKIIYVSLLKCLTYIYSSMHGCIFVCRQK